MMKWEHLWKNANCYFHPAQCCSVIIMGIFPSCLLWKNINDWNMCRYTLFDLYLNLVWGFLILTLCSQFVRSDSCQNRPNKTRSQVEIFMADNSRHSALQGRGKQVSGSFNWPWRRRISVLCLKEVRWVSDFLCVQDSFPFCFQTDRHPTLANGKKREEKTLLMSAKRNAIKTIYLQTGDICTTSFYYWRNLIARLGI